MAQHPTGDTSARAKPKRLLYVVTEDWFFCSHFLPMARAAKAAGFDVAIATRIGTKGEVLAAEGLSVFPLEGRRGRIGPIALIAESFALLRVMRRFRPDLLHLIALKPVLLAGMVGRLLRIQAIVCAVTGQGYLAAADGVRLASKGHNRSLLRCCARGDSHVDGTTRGHRAAGAEPAAAAHEADG